MSSFEFRDQLQPWLCLEFYFFQLIRYSCQGNDLKNHRWCNRHNLLIEKLHIVIIYNVWLVLNYNEAPSCLKHCCYRARNIIGPDEKRDTFIPNGTAVKLQEECSSPARFYMKHKLALSAHQVSTDFSQ